MSIATELTLLANSKQSIKASINAKGGSVTDSTPFADYSTAIDNLPSGGDNSDLINLIERKSGVGLIIPSGVTVIGVSAFANWTYLQNITIPNSVTKIQRSAFESCEFLTEIEIPENVTYIGTNAFSNCLRLASVNIPSGVTKIESGLMQNCRMVKSINIPSGVTTIEKYAFYSSGLISVNIPSGVTKIGDDAFSFCSALTSVTVNATTPPTTDGYQNPFNGTTCPIYVPAESVDAYKAATGWVKYADRIYPITQLATVDGNPVYNYEIGNTYSTVISDNERSKIPTGDVLEFSEGLEQIGGQLGAYEEVIMPSTFKSFDDTQPINAATTTLTCKATIPPGVEGNNLGGSGLTAIYVPSANVDTYKAASGWSTYADRIQAIPEDVKPAFKFTSSVDSSKDITVNCEDTATAGTLTTNDLGMSSQQMDEFKSAENTGSVEIGDCVKIYRAKNCYTAKGISEVKLNEGLERIEDFAFGGMSALREITIPSTVTNISYQAFYADRALESITCLATTPPTLGSDVFGDTNNCPIYVPAESVEAYKAATNWSTYADRIQAIPAE